MLIVDVKVLWDFKAVLAMSKFSFLGGRGKNILASKGSGTSPLAAESPLQDGFRRRPVAAPSLSPHEEGNLSLCD